MQVSHFNRRFFILSRIRFPLAFEFDFRCYKQLVSLAQAGHELNSDILKTQSKCTFILIPLFLEIAKMNFEYGCYMNATHVYSSLYFLLITVDKENIKPPVLDGLEALVAVSCVFHLILCFIYRANRLC